MIMNKRIFTLFISVVLACSSAFTASAAGPLKYKEHIGLGAAVQKLTSGDNGFYHLKVDSIVVDKDGNGKNFDIVGVNGATLNDTLVLFLGNETKNSDGDVIDEGKLFIDQLWRDSVLAHHSGEFARGKDATKAAVSAASLWCTRLNIDPQGVPTFTFSNKLYQKALEVVADDLENLNEELPTWDRSKVGGLRVRPAELGIGVSDWAFSSSWSTSIQQARPLYATLDAGEDSVAVLCLNADKAGSSGNWSDAWSSGRLQAAGVDTALVVVKIASMNDVKAGKVHGMLYFTLREAQPFVLSSEDFNKSMGIVDGDTNDPVDLIAPEGLPSVFTSSISKGYLKAGNFAETADSGVYVRVIGDVWPYSKFNYLSTVGDLKKLQDGGEYEKIGGGIDTTRYTNLQLDSLGYIYFTATAGNNNGKWLKVLPTANAYNSNDGIKYLSIDWSTRYKSPAKLVDDEGKVDKGAYDYGHYAFRLVYYPSTNDIRINAFQATHDANAEIAKKFGDIEKGGTPDLLDSIKRLRLTYVADTTALVPLKKVTNPKEDSTWGAFVTTKDSLYYLIAELRTGKYPYTTSFPGDFNFYQRLYVSPQMLSGTQVETLNDSPPALYEFPGYLENCKGGSGSSTVRKSVSKPGLFLIRNQHREYLNIPLYTSDNTPVWSSIKAGVDPSALPSYQWVVEKQYPDPTREKTSPVRITNREFANIQFKVVQLSDADKVLKISGYPTENSKLWNTDGNFYYETEERNGKEVVSLATAWQEAVWTGVDADPASYDRKTFIRIPEDKLSGFADRYTDENLGYTRIPAEEVTLTSFQLRYVNALTSTESYLGLQDEKEVKLYANMTKIDGLFFSVDTIKAHNDANAVGYYQSYGFKPENGLDADAAKANFQSQIPDLVALKRQPYYLVSQGLSQTCITTTSNYVTLDNNEKYYIGTNAEVEAVLGKPAYFLRNLQGSGKDASFALVQVYDATTASAGSTGLQAYLNRKYDANTAREIANKVLSSDDKTVFVAAVSPQTGELESQLRANVGQTTAAAFTMDANTGRLYRKFDDNTDVSFYTVYGGSTGYYLFENTGEYPDQIDYWKGGQKDYLGWINVTHPENQYASTKLTIDTAYVNRPDGDVKPQYMIGKDVTDYGAATVCDPNGNPTVQLPGYRKGRYLINAKDSAYVEGSDPPEVKDANYLWNNKWTRLVFVEAIHTPDYIYYLTGKGKSLVWTGGNTVYPKAEFEASSWEKDYPGLYKAEASGNYYLDTRELPKYARINKAKLTDDEVKANEKALIDAVNIGKDNTHKAGVFSFRIVERGAIDGNEDFIIESVGSDPTGKDKIAPCKGAWIYIFNGIPVLTQQDSYIQELMNSSSVFNVTEQRNNVSNLPVGVSPAPLVVSEVGGITIVGSSGKRVVLTNVLGQPIVSKVLTSDRESISLPKGIVLVSVDGSSVTKAVVK
jgi:hypothetical protein